MFLPPQQWQIFFLSFQIYTHGYAERKQLSEGVLEIITVASKPFFGGGSYLLCIRRFLSNACSIVYRDNAYGESRVEEVGIKGRWVAPKGKDSDETPPLVCTVLWRRAKACRERARAHDNNAIRFGRKRVALMPLFKE